MKRITKNFLAVVVTAALCAPMAAMATNGYFGHGIGMKSMGMAGAGIALTQDSMASATNPSAAASAGNRMDIGLMIFSPDREMELTDTGGGCCNGKHDGNDRSMFIIPEFGYNRDLGNDMAFALTVVGRGGMNSDYNKVNPFFGTTKAGINLAQLYISPTFAMKLNDKHSVGVALNIIHQRFQAEGLENFIPLAADGDGSDLTENGEDTSNGYSIGLGWTGAVAPGVTLGATYTTRGQMSEFDKYSDLFAEQGDFDIPASAGVGVAFEASPTTVVALDVTKIYYSQIASVNNPLMPNLGNCLGGDPTYCMGADDGPGFGWDDMTVFKLGVSWQQSKDLVLRAGWNHGKTPIPTSETFFNILAPATVENHITLGATKTMANGGELTFMYMHAFENKIEGSGSIPAAFGGGEADLKMQQNSFGVAYGWDM